MQRYRKLTTFCAAAVLAFGLAACGGGGSDDDQTMMQCPDGQIGTYPDCSDPQTPYDTAKAAIAAAETAEAAQAAYDAVKDDVTAAQGDMLQAAVDARIMALDTMARADEQKMALAEAAGEIDTSDLSTQEAVDAARAAIVGLRQAIAAAADVDDTSMYDDLLSSAVMAVDAAQGGIDTATRRTNQMMALSDASDTLQAALAALSGSTPTQAQLDAANDAVTGLNAAITAGADLTDAEKATYVREAANAAMPIQTAQLAFDNAEDEAEDAKNRAMRLMASRLSGGIGTAPLNSDSSHAGYRNATYNATATAITVTTGAGAAIATVNLSEDKKATVAANAGWAGKRYTHTVPSNAASGAGTPGDTYEAIVFSNVGDPTPGKKFGSTEAVTATSDFQYQLVAVTDIGNALLILGTSGTSGTALTTQVPANVSFENVTRTAGTETWKKPSPTASKVQVPGSYHGVTGDYYCIFGTGTCTATVDGKGFAFATGDWSFRPDNADAKVMGVPDEEYASYGWWLRIANGSTYTASAFTADKGTLEAITALPALQGTAKYVGGAAGKYSLFSLTGGTNDAGHFTARATLEADFGDSTDNGTVTGTIDQFIGADGEGRNWSVELMESGMSAAGAIAASDGEASTDATDPLKQTVWTIDGVAARSNGQWSGALKDQGDDGVPNVATGTFHSAYANTGRMVGAFGANKQ